jgi:hypothetical protein
MAASRSASGSWSCSNVSLVALTVSCSLRQARRPLRVITRRTRFEHKSSAMAALMWKFFHRSRHSGSRDSGCPESITTTVAMDSLMCNCTSKPGASRHPGMTEALDCFVAMLLAMTAFIFSCRRSQMTEKISLTAFSCEQLICPSCQSVAVDLKRKSAASLAPSRLDKRGVCAVVTKREAGCDGRESCTRRVRGSRTAKSCGPDASTPASSWRK